MPEKLKAGWTRVAFGDVVRLCRERSADPAEDGLDRFVGLEHLEPGDLKIRRWGNVADGTTFTNVFRAGQVLFGKRRAYQRKVAVADFDGVCSGDIYVLEPKSEHLLLDLLPFICQTDGFFEHAVGTSAGSLSPRTNWESLSSYEFALPPLDGQRRIAEALRATQECMDAVNLVAKRVSILRSAFFKQLFLSPHASQSNGELKDDMLRPGWRRVPACKLSSVLVTKGATPSAELTDVDTGIPFLKVYNLTFDGTLDFSIDPTFVTPAGHAELQRSVVLPGDILMNIVGPPLGKVSLVPRGFPECNINQAIVRYRPIRDTLLKWLVEFMLSSTAQDWLLARSKKTSGQRNLTLETCRELPVPVPPDDAINEIANQLTILGSSLIGIKSRIKQFNMLRKDLIATLEISDV